MSDFTAAPPTEWEPFRCDVVPYREAVHLEPAGELDLDSVDQVLRPLRDLLATGFRAVVIDLGRVTFLDSSGLRMLLAARDEVGAAGGTLKVLPGPPVVQRAFELTGLSEVFFS